MKPELHTPVAKRRNNNFPATVRRSARLLSKSGGKCGLLTDYNEVLPADEQRSSCLVSDVETEGDAEQYASCSGKRDDDGDITDTKANSEAARGKKRRDRENKSGRSANRVAETETSLEGTDEHQGRGLRSGKIVLYQSFNDAVKSKVIKGRKKQRRADEEDNSANCVLEPDSVDETIKITGTTSKGSGGRDVEIIGQGEEHPREEMNCDLVSENREAMEIDSQRYRSGSNDRLRSLVGNENADNVEITSEMNMELVKEGTTEDDLINVKPLDVADYSRITDPRPELPDLRQTESSCENGLNGSSDLTRQGNHSFEQGSRDPFYDHYLETHNGHIRLAREAAKRSAAHFAHFTPRNDETRIEDDETIKDWPGPYSTAMKIIKDRMTKSPKAGNFFSGKTKVEMVKWVPKESSKHENQKPLVPSLKELCLLVLAKHADEIVSLDSVPDILRHRLSQVLCDSRRMNDRFFELLLLGSPTEICLRDCSWLTEEHFIKSFQACDTSNLLVLKLDQCGRCIADYTLPSTLTRAANSLPSLLTLSLVGACRLSDIGLQQLLSSAPVLQSLNISQCSLLTTSSIDVISNNLRSSLRELYLNDCQNTDALVMLPALKNLEQLEVLSLAGVQNVCDDFVQELVISRGHKFKELILSDCVRLTDRSMKAISETCPSLYALDLVNLCKLTDSSLGHLANGCLSIDSLKLCRNSFSDEGVAAFLEISGELLSELSLNNVKKIGNNTAVSLAKRSRKLLKLDLSWCRNLTDQALGLIVDNCLSLRLLKLFGCTQVTHVFAEGHSNPNVKIIGLNGSVLDYSDNHFDRYANHIV